MKRRLVTVACVLSCLLLAHAAVLADGSRDLKQASSFVQRGDRAFQAGNLAKAKQMFVKAIERIPDFPEAHTGLGHVAMREGKFTEALAEYAAAKKGYSEISGLMYKHEVDKYLDAQREIRALEDQIQALQSPTVKVSESTRSQKTMQLRQAIQALRAMEYPGEEAAHQAPAELYFHIGNALYRLGRAEEAVLSWETCVAEDPDFALVYNNLAVAYMQQGRLEDAQDSVVTAEALGLQVNPNLKKDLEQRATAAGLLKKR